jgi:error-prone DNA polymerase
MTLEDETGFVNLVCWQDVYEAHRVLAKTAAFLGVTGTVQKKDGVTHLIAQKLWKPSFTRPSAAARSRDFR